jgi:hypothetical protein
MANIGGAIVNWLFDIHLKFEVRIWYYSNVAMYIRLLARVS